MNADKVRSFALAVNTVILALVFGLMFFFHFCGITFMTWFSIPTAMVYLIGYVLIKRNRMDIYVWMVYFWLTLYMCCSTVCLGYGYGFHLYCFSMIPVLFVSEYLAYQLQKPTLHPKAISFFIAAMYLISTGFTAYFGPVYHIEMNISAFFWVFNAMCVFGFLIYYSIYMLRTVIQSEEKLKDIAHNDRLTGLYNRHYMLECLANETEKNSDGFLAISDIDDFKKINDRYGHNAGDAVLKAVSDSVRKNCPDCRIARWGGEEFLFYSPKNLADGQKMMEQMRLAIASNPVVYEKQSIPVTLTVGIAARKPDASIDAWIQDADSKLYVGKKNGKNQVVV